MARRGGPWYANAISVILDREGHHERMHVKKTPSVPHVCDMARAAEHARDFRKEGLSLRQIGQKLRALGLTPPRARAWHAATVADLLMNRPIATPVSAVERAQELRQQGRSLRSIVAQLAHEGHVPPREGRWHPASISALLSIQQAALLSLTDSLSRLWQNYCATRFRVQPCSQPRGCSARPDTNSGRSLRFATAC